MDHDRSFVYTLKMAAGTLATMLVLNSAAA